MGFATTFTRGQLGIESPLITVETHVASGLPQILIVGLPETTVKESKDRVRAAIANSGLGSLSRKATVNLAPADLPKQGSRYDLAIATSLIAASQGWPENRLARLELIGEVGLDGSLRDPGGVLPAAIANSRTDRILIVPAASGAEAALSRNPNVRIASTLSECCAFIREECDLESPGLPPALQIPDSARLDDIRGQPLAKRALTIAAAGGHNLLLIGPPGTGKTMLASRLPALLPRLELDQALEVASVLAVSRYGFDAARWSQRPFRTPHHSASAASLVGGGRPIRPGEISLAHHGILFLDELPEFARSVLEVLREPLESGAITISRAAQRLTFPANFQLVATMNPCPCGYFGDESGRCNCPIERVERYRSKVSGPMMDRIDLHVEVSSIPTDQLTAPLRGDIGEHEKALASVLRAREVAARRAGKINAALGHREIERDCRLEVADRRLLEKAIDSLALSARACFKILKTARTIADLDGNEKIKADHLREAIGYRILDRVRA